MTAFKRTFVLGRQAIPGFASTCSLMQTSVARNGGNNFAGHIGSPFNMAALGFFDRGSGRNTLFDGTGTFGVASAYTIWGDGATSVAKNIFGMTKIVVPPWAEYFSVSWVEPTPNILSTGDPAGAESLFYVRWGLVL